MKKTIATYQIIEEVSRSAISIIYRAYQPSLDRVILLKVLYENLAHESDIVARFQREARACARIKHENIVDIFDYGVDQGCHYIAMEYVEGISLRQLLEKVEKLPLEIVIFITIEVLKGLTFAHSKGIFHRDIKPGNILLSFQGEVKITDFGLALLADSKKVTLQNTILGTPAYMSPEQISGDKLDERSDIFSLGATLYEMLTKRQAFAGKSYSESLNNVLNKDPIKLEKLKPELHPDLITVVKKMLAKKPSRRFETCKVVIDELSEFARNIGLSLSKKNLKAFIEDAKSYFKNEKTTESSPLKGKFTVRKVRTAVIAALIFISVILYYFKKEQYSNLQDNSHSLSDMKLEESIEPESRKDILPLKADQAAKISTPEFDKDERGLAEENKIELTDFEDKQVLLSPRGTLIIRCAPWAKVFIDKKYLKTLYEVDSLKIVVAPGPHEIIFVNSKFAPHDTGQMVVQVNSGEVIKLKIPFVETVDAGFLKLRVNPWAEVYVDEIYKGTIPLKPIILKQGKHLLTLKHPQLGEWEKEILIKTGETLQVAVDLMQKY